ncbi:MAG: rhamnulokinase [Prevotella sp.]|jgi:rhamnulokinase|nr:rhamnulokinase [Prevotella sp.]
MAYLALDLGAGSGRAIAGIIENGHIRLDEVHRFGNTPVKLGDTLYWDFLSLFRNIKEGIHQAVNKGYDLRGIAVDAWGVDFGLIDKKGRLISNPVCYRDSRTQGMMDKAISRISKEKLYAVTGIQQMEINSVFQLLSLENDDDLTLLVADKLLFIPDLINYYLTGKVCNEYTIASTSQLLNAQTKDWEPDLFDQLELPSHLMSEIVQPCSVIGKLKRELVGETGTSEIPVFAVGAHDTASAIAAIPSVGREWAFLSSGTWSLLGIQAEEPILTPEAMMSNFTNEGGVGNKILFMCNITGLWLLQRLIAEWERGDEECSYDYLLSECSKSEPFRSIVNTDDPAFTHPVSMSASIREYCHKTRQLLPQTKGELVRCVLESLAMKYHYVMKKLEACSGRNVRHLAVVGGGSQNELLNQYIADALNVEVVVGLTEATAIGNILQQAVADKKLKNMEEGRQIIKNSFNFRSYYPVNACEWSAVAIKLSHLFE